MMLNDQLQTVMGTVRTRVRWFDRQPNSMLVGLGLLAALVVGVLDLLAGHELSVSILYLMPVTFCAWHAGRARGIFMAVASAAILLVADILDGVPYENPLYAYWNATVLLGSFLVVVCILSALRKSRDGLEEMVEQRTAALRTEVAERRGAEERLLGVNAELAQKQEELLRAIADLKQSHTELKATQMQLIEAAKFESVGRLAAGVVHEVKNPLTMILMGTDYLAQVVPASDADAVTTLKDMKDAINRANTVIRDLLDYSRPGKLSRQPTDLNAVIDRSLSLIRYSLTQNHITLVKEQAGDLPLIPLDTGKIEQVFLNLFMNAIHAMPAGGTLTVRTFAAPGAGTGVVAETDDTGSGIPEAEIDKVFEPFFTTKKPGEGTGLGLAVAMQIIRLHGGTINLSNRKEGGVRARIVLGS